MNSAVISCMVMLLVQLLGECVPGGAGNLTYGETVETRRDL